MVFSLATKLVSSAIIIGQGRPINTPQRLQCTTNPRQEALRHIATRGEVREQPHNDRGDQNHRPSLVQERDDVLPDVQPDGAQVGQVVERQFHNEHRLLALENQLGWQQCQCAARTPD